jgi:hypothetical protein
MIFDRYPELFSTGAGADILVVYPDGGCSVYSKAKNGQDVVLKSQHDSSFCRGKIVTGSKYDCIVAENCRGMENRPISPNELLKLVSQLLSEDGTLFFIAENFNLGVNEKFCRFVRILFFNNYIAFRYLMKKTGFTVVEKHVIASKFNQPLVLVAFSRLLREKFYKKNQSKKGNFRRYSILLLSYLDLLHYKEAGYIFRLRK